MRIAAAVVMLWATSSACEPAREEPARAADSLPVKPVAQTRFYPTRPFAALSESAKAAIELERARAQGMVFSEFEGSVPAELTILNDTAYEVQTSARLRFYSLPDGGMTDTL